MHAPGMIGVYASPRGRPGAFSDGKLDLGRFAAAVWQQYQSAFPRWIGNESDRLATDHVALFAGFGVVAFGWISAGAGDFCGWICDGSLWLSSGVSIVGVQVPGGYFWIPHRRGGGWRRFTSVLTLPCLPLRRSFPADGIRLFVCLGRSRRVLSGHFFAQANRSR